MEQGRNGKFDPSKAHFVFLYLELLKKFYNRSFLSYKNVTVLKMIVRKIVIWFWNNIRHLCNEKRKLEIWGSQFLSLKNITVPKMTMKRIVIQFCNNIRHFCKEKRKLVTSNTWICHVKVMISIYTMDTFCYIY